MNKTSVLLVATTGSVLLFEGSAFAYIDPGTGSYVLQGVIAALMGGLLFLKMSWTRLKGLFRKKNTTDRNGP